MDTTQIYSIANEVARESMGLDDIDVIDTESLVAMGDAVLSSSSNTEAFLNTFVQRIGKTIISHRAYKSQLSLLDVGDMEFGQIMQKLKTKMPVAIEDDTYNLVDGESIDMYKVTKPVSNQKLFVKRTPVTYTITTQRKALKEAFTAADTLGSYLSSVFGEVRNAIELTQENLGRLTMANYMANAKTNQVYNLVTMFNAETGSSITPGMTAMYNEDFMRFAIGKIKNISSKMATMSVLYNGEEEQRHSPFEDQRFVYLVDFMTAMETQVQYAAFHDDYVKTASGIAVPYWQSAQTETDIKIEDKDSETGSKILTNVVAFIHDKEALGTYRKEEEALTTPVNAKGRYYNTFWHLDNLYFNDLSENGVVFTLN